MNTAEEIRILLVEDNAGDARLLEIAILDFQTSHPHIACFDLKRADGLEKAMKLVKQEDFDVILLDLSLPDSQGLETFQRAQEAAPDKPIIVLTGFDDEMLAIQAVREGAQDYLVKGQLDGNLLSRSIRYAIERKRVADEKETIQEQLFQSQKMEAIGNLAGGIAHDFNNLITAITGLTELAMLSLEEENPLFNDLKEIHEAGGRAADLTKQLLMFSRKHINQLESIDVNRLINKLLVMLHRLISEDIQIHTELDEKLWTVRADSGSIEQIVMNLAVNAKDAMPQGGVLLIKTENYQANAEESWGSIAGKDGRYMKLSIKDTGEGISEENLQHIFEPFFTTKDVGKGTGLGLSVVYGIVKQHNGWLHVDSTPGKGTTFQIFLPASKMHATDKCRDKISISTWRGHGERILLVEDEKGVREFAAKALIKNGYEVIATNDAKGAREEFKKQKGCFDLVLSDVVLPGESGIDLVKELLKRNPELKVIMKSGYPGKKSQCDWLQEKELRFLQKPYSVSDLLKNVREAIV